MLYLVAPYGQISVRRAAPSPEAIHHREALETTVPPAPLVPEGVRLLEESIQTLGGHRARYRLEATGDQTPPLLTARYDLTTLEQAWQITCELKSPGSLDDWLTNHQRECLRVLETLRFEP